MKLLLHFGILLLFSQLNPVLFAQMNEGVLSGTVIDKNNGEPLIGAIIQTEDNKFGVTADMDGKFILKLPFGHYHIVTKFISYAEQKIEVDINTKEGTRLNVALSEESVAMDEVVITYTVQKSSSIALLSERKATAVVSDGVSADMIKKTPDRNASDALKRVTGASIQDGKFAIIRGMNDRYNSAYLDGALLPSSESDRKAFAFDMIPSNLIDKIQIFKSGSPELIGDFGGGIIKIQTKAIPEKLTQQISIGAQTHSLTTFKSFNSYNKYAGESLNLLSSKRDLPVISEDAMRANSLFPSEQDRIRLAANSKMFNVDWNNNFNSANPNTRLAYSIGTPLFIKSDQKLGLIFAVNYSDTKKHSFSDLASFDGGGQVSDIHDNVYNQNISSGAILNLNYNSSKSQISLRNLLNINTDYNSIFRTGIGNLSEYIEVKNMLNYVSYNQLMNSILNYKQVIGKNFMNLDASVNYGNVTRKIPTYQIVSYTKSPEFTDYRLALGDFFNSSTGLFSSSLKENILASQLQLSKNFGKIKAPIDIKIGAGSQRRERSFASRNFVYGGQQNDLQYNPEIDLGKDNIKSTGLYLVEKTSDDLAYYNGTQNDFFTFISADQKWNNKFRALYGFRMENTDIHVFNERLNTEISQIKQMNVLPSVNFVYSLNEKTNFRASYFATVNRPEFRELAPFAFYAFDKNAEIKGNKNLKIAKLNNFDLRAECFPTGSQLISAGVFYKTIQNPIESSIDITQSFTTFTFNNGKFARIYGVELEMRKNFDFLGVQNIFKEISLHSNLAISRSQLEFEAGTQASQGRPLQGQSPYVFNCGLQYDSEKTGWSASLMLNQYGRRIAFVGVDPKFGETRQDIYEAPRTVVDFQIGRTIKKLNFKLSVGDLLKQDLIFYQDANLSKKFELNKDRKIFKYYNGNTASLSVNYTF